MRSISSKKGQLNSLAPAVIALIVAAFFLIMGVIILQSLRDTSTVTQSQTQTVSNETVNLNSSATQNYADFLTVPSFNSPVIVLVTNHSGVYTVVSAANYTAVDNATFTGIGGSLGIKADVNNTIVNVTYTYRHGDEAYGATNQTLVSLGNFSDFWEIIVLTIILTIVIGMLLVLFGGRGGR